MYLSVGALGMPLQKACLHSVGERQSKARKATVIAAALSRRSTVPLPSHALSMLFCGGFEDGDDYLGL